MLLLTGLAGKLTQHCVIDHRIQMWDELPSKQADNFVHPVGTGNALGLLRILHHGALQYQWDLAQYSDSTSEPSFGASKSSQHHGDIGECH